MCCDFNYFTVGADYDYGQRGEISDLFHLTDLYCYGSEYRITDCYYDDYIDIITHSPYYSKWIVYCSVG